MKSRPSKSWGDQNTKDGLTSIVRFCASTRRVSCGEESVVLPRGSASVRVLEAFFASSEDAPLSLDELLVRRHGARLAEASERWVKSARSAEMRQVARVRNRMELCFPFASRFLTWLPYDHQAKGWKLYFVRRLDLGLEFLATHARDELRAKVEPLLRSAPQHQQLHESWPQAT